MAFLAAQVTTRLHPLHALQPLHERALLAAQASEQAACSAARNACPTLAAVGVTDGGAEPPGGSLLGLSMRAPATSTSPAGNATLARVRAETARRHAAGGAHPTPPGAAAMAAAAPAAMPMELSAASELGGEDPQARV